ncbi:hypothetical protein QM480_07245 [Flectobacillus sp. DC10W]|jgi:hypothetical protein|uniref:Lipoprotein n=1 Tax=Flectobacillus longus TaxID=2984207 RepID=A0ABT6YKI8_9BACT|nr:hypothetical protein [Flectobacillus longus]MDI9864112.1 hypothetical protein [Flectobacillus longus]
MKKAIISGFLMLGIVATSLACPGGKCDKSKCDKSKCDKSACSKSAKTENCKDQDKKAASTEKKDVQEYKVKADAKASNKVAIWTSPYFSLDKPGC